MALILAVSGLRSTVFGLAGFGLRTIGRPKTTVDRRTEDGRPDAKRLIASGSKAAARGLAYLGHFVPAYARRRKDDPLGEAVSARDVDVAAREIEHLDQNLVARPGIVGI